MNTSYLAGGVMVTTRCFQLESPDTPKKLWDLLISGLKEELQNFKRKISHQKYGYQCNIYNDLMAQGIDPRYCLVAHSPTALIVMTIHLAESYSLADTIAKSYLRYRNDPDPEKNIGLVGHVRRYVNCTDEDVREFIRTWQRERPQAPIEVINATCEIA